MKVAIVTPTIGSTHLKRCLDSVQGQDYYDFVHYVFIDGKQYDLQIKDTIFASQKDCGYERVETISLSENVGKGWYGHRVYAACSFLVNADIICYLDEDNWLEPNHIQSLVDVIKNGSDWAYSLRNIYSKEGKLLCKDDCESLGKWPVYFDPSVKHIDTSCFAIQQSMAVGMGHVWYAKWGADRHFFGALQKYYPNYGCTGKYTLNYRLDGNDNSVTEDFFSKGNKVNFKKYNGIYPWRINE